VCLTDNYGREQPIAVYKILDDTPDGGVEKGKVEWKLDKLVDVLSTAMPG
jgi:predicted dithiol-disulfide oxidoreductase (DUF899 family)